MLTRETLESAMRRALDIARRGPRHDANPQVGCVLLDPEGRIIAESWHRGAGTAHAEVDALSRLPQEWRGRLSELTAVITLEPCNHTGRTGPCSVALVNSRIGSVAFAVNDPGEVSGGGAGVLRDAGVHVESGILAGAARTLLAPWLAEQAANRVAVTTAHTPRPAVTTAHTPRPAVTIKWAQTLDGRAAAADGSSQWITGSEARADVHLQRARADAILVGTGTLLADDPALTARDASGALLVAGDQQPLPIVLGHRNIPENARIRQHPALAAHGLVEPLRFSGSDLAADLTSMYAQGIRHVFVEGGPTIASAFIAAGLADELLIYLAPALLGGPQLALGELGIASMSEIMRFRIDEITPLGADFRITASLDHTAQHHTAQHHTAQLTTTQHTEEQL